MQADFFSGYLWSWTWISWSHFWHSYHIMVILMTSHHAGIKHFFMTQMILSFFSHYLLMMFLTLMISMAYCAGIHQIWSLKFLQAIHCCHLNNILAIIIAITNTAILPLNVIKFRRFKKALQTRPPWCPKLQSRRWTR